MSNETQSVCQNFPYVFKGDVADYLSAILTLVTLFNSSFLSAAGNLVVAFVFRSTRQLRQKRLLVLTINLTLINLCTALLGIPTYFVFLLSFAIGNAWCELGDVSFAIHRYCFSMTVVGISLVSYQRYFSVLYPYRYQALVTLERNAFVAVASWFYGLILAIPLAVEIQKPSWPFLSWLCVASKAILVVHIATTVLCYVRMAHIALGHRKGIARASRHLEKTRKTSLRLVGTMLATTLPWLVLNWARTEHSIQAEYVANTVFFSSCLFNLLLYTLRNEEIESAVRRKFKRKVSPELPQTRARTTALQPRPNFTTTTNGRWVKGL